MRYTHTPFVLGSGGVPPLEVSVTSASWSHRFLKTVVWFGVVPRVYVPRWPGGFLSPLSLQSISSPSHISCSPHTPTLLSERKCEAFFCLLTYVHQVSQRSPEGLVSLPRVETCSGTHPFIGFIPFPDSLPHSFYGASWNFLPHKPLAPKSLSKGLLLGEPKFNPAGPYPEAVTVPTLLYLPFGH